MIIFVVLTLSEWLYPNLLVFQLEIATPQLLVSFYSSLGLGTVLLWVRALSLLSEGALIIKAALTKALLVSCSIYK